jgi:tetratricopeptide (TPR) repeat protein
LILAIMLRRTRWPQLLPAAAATFLFLSMSGIIELSVEWSSAKGYGTMVGAFHLTRRAFLNPKVSDAALGTLGATQLLLEFATGLRVIPLILAFRGVPAEVVTKQERARRARYGRIGLYTAIGFLFVAIRLPVWSTYIELLNNSTLVRNFILENDTDRRNWRRIRATQRTQLTEEERRLNDCHFLVSAAVDDARSGRYADARERYQKAIEAIEAMPEESRSKEGRALLAQAFNNLAWLEATCPDTSVRDSRDSVKNARRATKIEPDSGNYWNTLGAAQFRSGEWDEARKALARSMSLRSSGDSFDWFFLSMIDRKTGNDEDARTWYDKAVVWFHESSPQDMELLLLQVEAAQALGLPKPEAPTAASRKAQIARSMLPRSIHRRGGRRQAEEPLKTPQ